MRIATLVLAILGGLAAIMLGAIWLSDAAQQRETLEVLRSAGISTAEIDGIVRTAYILIVGGLIGIVAGVLAFRGKSKVAAGILAIVVVIPAVLMPKTLVFTFLLAIAALLAFLSKPRTV